MPKRMDLMPKEWVLSPVFWVLWRSRGGCTQDSAPLVDHLFGPFLDPFSSSPRGKTQDMKPARTTSATLPTKRGAGHNMFESSIRAGPSLMAGAYFRAESCQGPSDLFGHLNPEAVIESDSKVGFGLCLGRFVWRHKAAVGLL